MCFSCVSYLKVNLSNAFSTRFVFQLIKDRRKFLKTQYVKLKYLFTRCKNIEVNVIGFLGNQIRSFLKSKKSIFTVHLSVWIRQSKYSVPDWKYWIIIDPGAFMWRKIFLFALLPYSQNQNISNLWTCIFLYRMVQKLHM